MNRRTAMFGAAGTALAFTSVASGQSTPVAEDNSIEGYRWAASTWYDIIKRSREQFVLSAEIIDGDWSTSYTTTDLLLEMGVWRAVYVDAMAVAPPEEFADFHTYLLNRFEILERASRKLSEGILLGDVRYVNDGLEDFEQGDIADAEFEEKNFASVLIGRPQQGFPSSQVLPVQQSEVVASRGTAAIELDEKEITFSTGPTVGDPNAPVTMHLFSNFECKYCVGFHYDSVPRIEEEFIRHGLVKMVFHDYARIGKGADNAERDELIAELEGPNNESSLAAQAAMCAGEQNKYLEMSDLLFSNSNGVGSGAFQRENLTRFAESLDLDVDAFKESHDSGRYIEPLADSILQAQEHGIFATPMFYLENGGPGAFIWENTDEGYTMIRRQIRMSLDTAK